MTGLPSMKRWLPSPLTACAAVMLLAAAGCSSAAVYRLDSGRVHKDLVVCNVRLSNALDVDEYSRIARWELDGLLRSPIAAAEEGVPLYEARFEFLVAIPGKDSYHKVATVRFSLLTPEALPHIILYPPVF